MYGLSAMNEQQLNYNDIEEVRVFYDPSVFSF